MYIIKSPDELKDPFLCFCVFNRFNEEAGEDYLDCNEDIINTYPFIFWMYGSGYINNFQLEALLQQAKEQIDKYGFRLSLMDILYSDTLFPNTLGESEITSKKGLYILADYMSCCKDFRQRVYDSVNDGADSFINNQFYKDDNGISLACKINDDEMVNRECYTLDEKGNIIAKEGVPPFGEMVFRLSYKEYFDLVSKLTILEADSIEC
jgi:hypothetical protein